MISLLILGLLLLPFLLIGGGLALFWKRKRRAVLRWSGILYLLAIISVFFGISPYLVAWAITQAGTRPPDRLLTDTPGDYQVSYEDVVFESQDALQLRGWFLPPADEKPVLICTHGLFRNRVELLQRVVPLCKAGYGALLYDSRSHGASARGTVSLGYHERKDVLGAIRYVESRYSNLRGIPSIVLMGVSMGAVASLEAAAETDRYSALILDSPFWSFRQTVVDHSWLMLKMPRIPFSSLVLFWFGRMAGFDPDQVESCKAIRNAKPVPLLLIASKGDRRIPYQVANSLFAESKAVVKRIKIFGEDVPHGAAARMHSQEYSATLMRFLDAAFDEKTSGSSNRGSNAAANFPK
jgi:pimeloyl-ACP methyl ester carboxylesterase